MGTPEDAARGFATTPANTLEDDIDFLDRLHNHRDIYAIDTESVCELVVRMTLVESNHNIYTMTAQFADCEGPYF